MTAVGFVAGCAFAAWLVGVVMICAGLIVVDGKLTCASILRAATWPLVAAGVS